MDLVVKTFKNYRKGKLRYLADFALHLFPKKMRTHPSSLLANVKIQREVKEKKKTNKSIFERVVRSVSDKRLHLGQTLRR